MGNDLTGALGEESARDEDYGFDEWVEDSDGLDADDAEDEESADLDEEDEEDESASGDESDEGDEDEEEGSEADADADAVADLKLKIAMLEAQLASRQGVDASAEGEDVGAAGVEAALTPFESDEWKNLSDVMEWSREEQGMMKAFFGKLLSANNAAVVKHTLGEAPKLVDRTVAEQARMRATAERFYQSNPELSEVKPYVKVVADQVAGELGAKAPMELVLRETAKRVYKTLGLKRAGRKGGRKASAKGKPAFGKRKSARKPPARKPSRLQSELDEILDLE